MPTTSTLSGTQINEGIEFNEFPPPSELIKAMESKWAEQLIKNGSVRLNPLSYYQSLESEELGDNLEGLGELRVDGHPYSMSSINETFVWCCANPETDHATLLSLDDNYDVIIKISDPIEFVKRISKALREAGYEFSSPHAGRINYNRSDEVTLPTLQEQMWEWNSFQKSLSYQHQNEFRFVFTELSFSMDEVAPIDLSIGNCEDIIELVPVG